MIIITNSQRRRKLKRLLLLQEQEHITLDNQVHLVHLDCLGLKDQQVIRYFTNVVFT